MVEREIKRHTKRKKKERDGGNESLLVEKAVVQEEKDERIKKGMSRKRAQCVGNSSC